MDFGRMIEMLMFCFCPFAPCSQYVQSLMQLCYETLHEATTSKPQCAIQLFYAVKYVFELYCNVVPTYHKDSLTQLPQLAGKYLPLSTPATASR